MSGERMTGKTCRLFAFTAAAPKNLASLEDRNLKGVELGNKCHDIKDSINLVSLPCLRIPLSEQAGHEGSYDSI